MNRGDAHLVLGVAARDDVLTPGGYVGLRVPRNRAGRQ
jgi:hypothetical protein